MSIIKTLKSRVDLKNKKAIVVTIDELIDYRQYLKENNLPIIDKFWNCDLILEVTKEQKKAVILEWQNHCAKYYKDYLSLEKLLKLYLND